MKNTKKQDVVIDVLYKKYNKVVINNVKKNTENEFEVDLMGGISKKIIFVTREEINNKKVNIDYYNFERVFEDFLVYSI